MIVPTKPPKGFLDEYVCAAVGLCARTGASNLNQVVWAIPRGVLCTRGEVQRALQRLRKAARVQLVSGQWKPA